MHKTSRPRVKICCIKSLAEAWMAIEAGAAALGLVSAMPSGPGILTDEEIARIAPAIPPAVSTFLLTSLTSAGAIVRQHRFCQTSTIQICDYLPPGEYAALRESLPGVRIVQVIHVLSERDLEFAESIAPRVDALLLDLGDPLQKVKQLGGTGRVHNWSLSRRIREQVAIPLFLAGGLNAGNVAQAIAEVGPFGVDVCSGVRTNDRLDQSKLAGFMAAVQRDAS